MSTQQTYPGSRVPAGAGTNRAGIAGSCLLWLMTAALLPCLGGIAASGFSTPRGGDELSADARRPLSEIAGVDVLATQPSTQHAEPTAAVRQLYLDALDFLADGNLVLAEARLDEALRVAGDSWYEPVYEAARVKLLLRGPDAALPIAERAAALRSAGADIRFLLGEIHERRGDLPAAIANFRAATAAAERELNNPQVSAAWFRLGLLLERRGFLTAAEESLAQFDDAIWESHVEHRSAPSIVPILAKHPAGALELRLALLERLGRSTEAVRLVAEAARRAPDSAELARQHARALLSAGRAPQAFELCKLHLERTEATGAPDRGFLALAVEAAIAADLLGPWVSDAVAAVERGQRVEFAQRLARKLGEGGRAADAVRIWIALEVRAPGEPSFVWSLALARRTAGEYDKAFASLADFLRSRSNGDCIPGSALRDWMNSHPAAPSLLDALTTASKRNDRDYATDFVLATAAVAAQQRGLAESLLRACLAARPDYFPAEAAWGAWLLEEFRWEEARRHADAALAIAPGYAPALLGRAEAAAGLDDNETASRSFREAVRAAPRDALYRLALADHTRRLGELTAAQRYYQEALELGTANGPAAEGLITSYVEERKLDLARSTLERLDELDISEDVRRRVRTIVRYADSWHQDEHLAELRRQSDQSPADGDTALAWAAALLARGRMDDAAAAVERAERALPDDARTVELTAHWRMRQLDFERGVALYERLARRYPNRTPTLRRLADAYLTEFRLDEGRAVLTRLIALAGTEEERDNLRGELAGVNVELREYDAALQVLNEAVAARPTGAAFRAARIATLRLAGRCKEALDDARLWLDASGDDADRRIEFVKSAIAAGEADAALERITAWRAANPDDWTLLYLLVKVQLAAGRPDAALQLLSDFRPGDLDSDFHRRLLLARCKAAAGRLESALAELDALINERALQGGAYHEVGRETLVELCMKYNAPDVALERLNQWSAAESERAPYDELRILYRKRSVLSASNRLDECIAVMEQLLSRLGAVGGPTDDLIHGLYNDLGYMLVDRGQQLERATDLLRRALGSRPRNSAFLDSYGWALYKTGDFAGAEKYIGRAVRLRDGQDPVLFDHLGDAQYRRGNPAAAETSWRRAVELLLVDAERVAAQENETDEFALPAPAGLLPQVRAKLVALEQGEAPNIARLAAGR